MASASTPSGRATLTVRDGAQRGQVHDLKAVTTVGRSKSCTLSIDDADMSRTHFVIEFEASEHTVRDNGSANGTLLNGRRISTAALRHGDRLTAGNTNFVFQVGIAAKSSNESSVRATAALSVANPPFHAVTRDTGLDALATALSKYKVLFQTTELINRLPQDEGFFRLMLEKLLEAEPAADRGLVLLGNTETDLTLVAKVGRFADVELQPVSTSLLKRVLSDGEALLVHDTLLDERLHDAESVLATGSRSLMCAPLRTADTTFGAIQLESHRRQAAFDENDLQLLAALARQAAVALSHARIESARREAVDRAALRRFVNAGTSERLMKAEGSWKAPASAHVSLLFVDLRELTAGVAPKDLPTINAAVSTLAELVFAHGGTVTKLTPDALAACWGAPLRQVDDARQAVEAALDMQAHWRREGRGALRAVLHAGTAVVGEFGASVRNEYTALGADVEDAARLTGHVEPGAVAASQAFYTELSTALEGEWSEPFALRPDGRAPVRLFKISAHRF